MSEKQNAHDRGITLGTRVELNSWGKETFVHQPHWRTLRGTVTDVSADGWQLRVRRDTQSSDPWWTVGMWDTVAELESRRPAKASVESAE